MSQPTTPRTCRRCHGTGEHSFNRVWGTTCMACEGHGVIRPPAPAPRDYAAEAEFHQGMAARLRREVERHNRRGRTDEAIAAALECAHHQDRANACVIDAARQQASARNRRDAIKAPAEFTIADAS